MTATHASTPVSADRIDLVDEHDRRSVGLGLLEQIPHAAGADTDEHLDEVRAGDRIERHSGFAGDCTREKRLAGARLTVEQHTLRDLGPYGLELRGLLQELLDLLELLDCLVGTGDVGERGLGHVRGDELGLGLAEIHDPVAAPLHLPHEEEEQEHDEQHREEGVEQ
ncbi:unannotated protein [freshwater metagenome]|uniref:Unannotated protein n=1 Tax=freshwater metagenome TaxID=449393 RepID=A0A6J7BVS4_9ZZZZ